MHDSARYYDQILNSLQLDTLINVGHDFHVGGFMYRCSDPLRRLHHEQVLIRLGEPSAEAFCLPLQYSHCRLPTFIIVIGAAVSVSFKSINTYIQEGQKLAVQTIPKKGVATSRTTTDDDDVDEEELLLMPM